MHISFTIPEWVFHILAAYYLVGVLLFAPFWHWSNRFVSPRRTGRESWMGARPGRVLIGVLVSGAIWPWFLKELLRSEWKYGLGKKWRNRKV